MLEKDIVKSITTLLKRRGAWVMKTHGSPMSAGYPDILACYRGFFLGLEVKRPSTRDTVTSRQSAQLELILHAGGRAAVVDNVQEVMDILDLLDLWVGC